MHGGLGEELFDGRVLPGCQGLMQLQHVLQDGRLGEGPIDPALCSKRT
jgi:hypothetical protein